MLHDNMVQLFPEYWQSVPMGFDLIFAGALYFGEEQRDVAVNGASASPAVPL